MSGMHALMRISHEHPTAGGNAGGPGVTAPGAVSRRVRG